MSQPDSHSPPARGFTLVELLIVISIIAILISLLFVGYPKINTLLKERACQGNLRSIGQILQQYCEWNKGFYPDGIEYYGYAFDRYQRWGDVRTGPPMPAWTALANLNQMKEMGATEAMFTCPFATVPPGTQGTWDAPLLLYDSWSNYWYYEVQLPSYTVIFGRGVGGATTLCDGRRPVITSTCPPDSPIMADFLYLRTGGSLGGGFYHGGGVAQAYGGTPTYGLCSFIPNSTTSPGYNNSACNTLFAGGYIIHNEPGDFQDPNGNMSTTKFGLQIDGYDTWWFALGPTTN